VPDSVWRLAPRVDLHWRRWDAEWVVFDAGSGQTHKTDTLTAMTLMVLEDGPARPGAVQDAIARELELGDDALADVAARLPELLADLGRLGLAETIAG